MSQNGERRFVGPPDALDRYALIERRASGGEGEVWQAVESHGVESFRYAVKMIQVDDATLVDRHLEELRLQAALATHLEHPALVAVKEVFVGPPPHLASEGGDQMGRRLYLVMKWLHGRSMQEALERGEMRGLDVLAPLESIADAIDYLHSGRDTGGVPVIHRDIKPANVLLAADGRVYLVDFGLVRLRSTDRTSRIFGTAPFMAPESLARGEYTPATDRYTLGATVYFALTGEAPISGDIEGMSQRLTAALGPGRDREIRGILAMLAVRPEARPASAGAWVRGLRAAPMETSVGLDRPGLTLPPTTGPSGIPLGPPPTGPGGTPPGPPTMGPTVTPPGPPTMGPNRNSPPPPPYPPAGPSLSPVAAGSGVAPPRLSAAAGGYLGAPPMPAKKRGGFPTPLIVLGVVLLAVIGCCVAIGQFSQYGGGTGIDGAKPTRSFDKGKPPPPATELRTALVSVADISAVLRVERQAVYQHSDATGLQGGLSKLKLCDDSQVDGAAIGSTESGGYLVSDDGSYPYVSSAVAGFYSDEATVYFTAAREAGSRCGWSEMRVPKLGNETLGLFADDGTNGRVAIVFVRTGQVIVELSVKSETSGSYQSDAIQLASRVAKRIPKGTG